MKKNAFGGQWTEEKLNRLRAYLLEYRRIFTTNERARFLKTVYIDAFASSGYRSQNANELGPLHDDVYDPDDFGQPETQAFYKGSTRIALEIDSPFDEYLFIELDAKRYQELENLKNEFPDRTITVVNDDANRYLKTWCRETNWSRTRAVVFLDPFGMQVEWSLLEAIARTKAIDVWLLFPIGMGVMRMLTNNSLPPPVWANKLTKVFGTDSWRQEFYVREVVPTLFGDEERETKDVDFDAIQAFFVSRLKEIFVGVAPNPLILRNSRNVPLYLLCFAASNEKGAKPALRIAEHLLKG